MVNGTEVELVSRSAMTETLIANFEEPIADTAKLLGIPKEKVLEKYAQLYEDRGWGTERMREMNILTKFEDLLASATKELDNAEDTTQYASMFGKIIIATKLLLDRIDARKKSVEVDVNKLTLYQARIMSSAISLAMERSVFDLQKLYPQIDPDEVQDVFDKNLPLAVKELEG